MKAILLLALGATASAQTIEVKSLFQPAALSGVWKHQMGDDRRWSDPSFDDSAWQSVAMPEGTLHPGDGFSWYRLRVKLPETMPKEPLALMIGGFNSGQAYEVFWNGQSVGHTGAPDGGLKDLLLPRPKAFAVAGASGESVVAIRLRAALIPHVVRLDASHLTSWLGTSQSINVWLKAWYGDRTQQALATLLVAACTLMAALFFLVLPLWRQDAPEYFWFGLWLLFSTANRLVTVYPEIILLRTGLVASWSTSVATVGNYVAWLGLLRWLFNKQPTRTVWLFAVLAITIDFSPVVYFTAGGSEHALLGATVLVINTFFMSFTYFRLGWQTRRENEAGWGIHVAMLAYLATNFMVFGGQMIWTNEAFRIVGTLVRTVALLAFTVAVSVLMNSRSSRLLRERERLSRELESAAEVQQLLLSSSSGADPLLEIDPVYLPAQEVGGDFYVVLDHQMLVVGDVSGKGLKAAMQVSATVGALRALHISSPGALLAALNDSLAGHTGGGFVTCVCVRFDAHGMTVANAGHIPPYRNGMETEVDSGLPLGVIPGMDYPETTLPFEPGDIVMVLSDGVVEAANAAGELFGFDRTTAISGKSAEEIAAAAKTWGQTDDITVVTVRRNVSTALNPRFPAPCYS